MKPSVNICYVVFAFTPSKSVPPGKSFPLKWSRETISVCGIYWRNASAWWVWFLIKLWEREATVQWRYYFQLLGQRNLNLQWNVKRWSHCCKISHDWTHLWSDWFICLSKSFAATRIIRDLNTGTVEGLLYNKALSPSLHVCFNLWKFWDIYCCFFIGAVQNSDACCV